MSIGHDLAGARRQAGLTVTQVSQQTCIRETIIRGIERDDYAGCGGDVYARGHIRAIARAVGADPGPLIREYNAAHPARQAVTASDLLQPASLAGFRERRRLNWSAVLGLALVAVIGFAAYHVISASHHAPPAASGAAGRYRATNQAGHGTSPPAVASPTLAPYAHEVVVHMAARKDCWVEFTTPAGAELFQSYVVAGASRSWTFRHAVDMRLGNPGGVRLTVDGKNPLPPGTAHPITLSLGLHGQA